MEPPQKAFTGEIAACLALMLLSIAAWFGFAAFFYQTLSMQAAFAFMQHHRALGENPDFILGAVYGLAQPPDVLLAQWPFQASVVLVLLQVSGLAWIAIHLWKARPQESLK